MGDDLLLSRHIKYFEFNLGVLPSAYSSLDTSRMTALYFNLISLDLLGKLDSIDKQNVIEWIYSMQVSDPSQATGGFRGSSWIGADHTSPTGAVACNKYDVGHLAMTYTALCALITLGDDLSRVKRSAILDAVRALQLPNGSFAPVAESEEHDTRFVYCAAAISYMLNDFSAIDIDRCEAFLLSCFSYEGGIALNTNREAHGGATYTALASFALLGRLSSVTNNPDLMRGLRRWCFSRLNQGFNGRPNKIDDTCYTFWIGASLSLIGCHHLLETTKLRQFLLETQTPYGGFGKYPEALPDILHSFYGLAGWSLLLNQSQQISNPITSALAISERAVQHLNQLTGRH